MSNVVEVVVNNQIENSFTAQVSQLEQYEQDTLVCPGAPKLPSFESFEGPFLVDDELLAYYNRAPVTSPSLTQPESLEEDDGDTWVCPGAPKLGFSEYCDGLDIMTDEPPFCHNCCSSTSLAQLEPHLEDDDRDKLVCTGAPNLEYFEFVDGLNIISNEPLGPFHSPLSPIMGLDSDDDVHPRTLFGLFPEPEPEPSVTFHICSVPMCRDSEVTSGSILLSTPPPPAFIEQNEGVLEEKEVEITSGLVIAGGAGIVLRDEECQLL
ncbi:hypothetical protein CPB86DRAFT_809697 [Serendipita vermifera]|nr:hypothetical protein CPB86DRAFT_809697 [Serendipita vermifera]